MVFSSFAGSLEINSNHLCWIETHQVVTYWLWRTDVNLQYFTSLGSSRGQGFVNSEVSLRQDLLQVKFFAKVAIYRLARKNHFNQKEETRHYAIVMTAGLSQFQYIIILILGSKEVLLLAKNWIYTSFLVSQKVMIGINGKQMSKTTALMQERINLSL